MALTRLDKVLLPAALLLLPFALFFWMLPFAGRVTLGNDYPVFHIQQQLELQYSLHQGTFPLYAPGFAGGRSASALTLGQLYHPFSHLASRLPGYWKGHALDWMTFLRLLSLGIAQCVIFLLLRRWELNRPAAFTLSFITIFNLRMLDLFRYGPSLESFTAFLLLTASLAFVWMRPGSLLPKASLVACTWLLVCGGHPQIMHIGLIGFGIMIFITPLAVHAIAPEAGPARGKMKRYFLTAFLSLAAGVALASPYWMTFFLEFVRENPTRVGQDYSWSLAYGDTPGGALNSFFMPLRADVHGAFGSSPIVLLALTGPPLLFLLAPVFRNERPGVRKVLAGASATVWVLSLLVFLFSLGDFTPVHRLAWKYVPFVKDWRVPGRVTMLLPGLFLFQLGLMTKAAQEHRRQARGVVAVTVGIYLAYHLFIVNRIPPPASYTPMAINRYAAGVENATFWLGLATLLLAGAVLPAKKTASSLIRNAAGLFLILAVIGQSALQIRYGTWVGPRKPTWSLDQIERMKTGDLGLQAESGFGLEPPPVIEHIRRSSLESDLARFYRRYQAFPSREEVYSFLAATRAVDEAAVENPEPGLPPAGFREEGKISRRRDEVRLLHSTFNRLLFEVRSGAPGLLVLSYPYSDRWEAKVDGKGAPLLRANGYALGLTLPGGDRTVEFRYRSRAAEMGVLVASLTLVAILLVSSRRFSGRARRGAALAAAAIPAAVALLWFSSLYSGRGTETVYRWTSDDFPPPGNVAYGKRTSMSSISNRNRLLSFYAGLAVDGTRSGPPFMTGDREASPWWEVDLGRELNLGKITLFWPAAAPPGLPLEIALSSDGRRYRRAYRLSTGDLEGKSAEIALDGRAGRYVRLVSGRNRPLALTEVEVYGRP